MYALASSSASAAGPPGRQPTYIETPAQRRAREVFLQRRAWARRISAWAALSNPADRSKAPYTNIPHAHALAPWRYTSDGTSDTDPSDSEGEIEAEEEPYMIYSTSPAPRVSTSIAAPSTTPIGAYATPRRRHRRTVSRRSSLSSIREVEEEERARL